MRPSAPAAVLGVLLASVPLTAQLPPADAFALGAGGDLPRASAAEASNPAALAAGSGWELVLSPLRLGLGLTPISGADLAAAGDGVLSRARREAWLAKVDRGTQRGVIDVAAGQFALRRGPLALTLATVLTGETSLPADAVELLLFGNAGRSGVPRDLRLAGARVDGAAFTTVGLAWGAPASEQLDLGARLHADIGHGALVTRDAGSVLDGEDATATLQLPTLASTGTTPGFGVGLDLGMRWRGARSATGVAVHNVVTSFEWSERDLRFREGETLIEGAGVASDFDARPAAEAPATLRALLRRLRPGRRIEIEHVRALREGLNLRLTVRERLERGLSPGAPDARLVGLEWRLGPRLDLSAHTGAVEGDWRLGGGLRTTFGAWVVSGAWLLDRGDDRRGSTLGLSLGWRPATGTLQPGA